MEAIGDYYLENDVVKEVKKFDLDFKKNGKNFYEVIKISNGIPLFLNDHLDRLFNTFKLENTDLWLNCGDIREKISLILEANKTENGILKLVFNIKENTRNFYGYFIGQNHLKDTEYVSGVNTGLFYGRRIKPNSKIVDNSLRTETNKVILERKLLEVILVNDDNTITEGSRSNIYFVKGEKIITVAIDKVLPGITRSKVMEICTNLKYTVEEKVIEVGELKTFDGAFMSTTPLGIVPIKRIDDIEYKVDENDIVKAIVEEYRQMIKAYVDHYKKP